MHMFDKLIIFVGFTKKKKISPGNQMGELGDDKTNTAFVYVHKNPFVYDVFFIIIILLYCIYLFILSWIFEDLLI